MVSIVQRELSVDEIDKMKNAQSKFVIPDPPEGLYYQYIVDKFCDITGLRAEAHYSVENRGVSFEGGKKANQPNENYFTLVSIIGGYIGSGDPMQLLSFMKQVLSIDCGGVTHYTNYTPDIRLADNPGSYIDYLHTYIASIR